MLALLSSPLIVHAQSDEDNVAERDGNDRPTLYYYNKRNVDRDYNESRMNKDAYRDQHYDNIRNNRGAHSPYFSPYYYDDDGAPFYQRTSPIDR